MLSFECDYNNGAHDLVLRHLVETNGESSLTYGFDRWSNEAREKIKTACGLPEAEVFFLQGGTQANAVVIDSLLRSYEGVVCADSGHINVHEAGAIEATGHRVIALPADNGKLSTKVLEHYLRDYHHDESREHVAQPGMVYITFPTEMGTLYSSEEIAALYDLCLQHRLPLFIDGARLAYGLAALSEAEGMAMGDALAWIARHCDAFYIGGTKCGALSGEAVVFTSHHVAAPRGFFSNVKRHGALSAKGRLAGVQFDALFSSLPSGEDSREPLYFQLGRHAVGMAMKVKEVLREAGCRFFIESPTNQQFVVMPNKRVGELKPQVDFTVWGPYDADNMLCRFVTSWSTSDEDIARLRDILSV
ncbi:MAG: aminotransferase class V-fold PLP-dependent enzyme [Prevotella sp.]|nr:aminotransferase class V-fold PLP-dependent enzyme [Prevotella sp.]